MLFTLTVASLIIPSILVSLGIGLLFNLTGLDPDLVHFGIGRTAHLDAAVRPADHVRGVQPLQPRDGRKRRAISAPHPGSVFRHVVLPIIAPSVVGVALFGFTLSYDEFARTLLTAGSDNTLPLEIFGMTTNVTTPVLYALGTVTTALSFLVIGVAIVTMAALRSAVSDRRSESATQADRTDSPARTPPARP